MTPYVGRFAPSPSGLLHVGNAFAAFVGWLHARQNKGTFRLRIEDLDQDRSKKEFVDSAKRDLEYLGLTWDGPTIFQQERLELYQAACEKLLQSRRAFNCTCSRQDVKALASAPHEGEEGPIYPGTCRKGTLSHANRVPSLRFDTRDEITSFVDLTCGLTEQNVDQEVGPFVIRRSDGVFSYQLAVVVDDAEMGITHVLRGRDLLTSTPRQLQIFSALELAAPRFAHLPLVMSEHGQRLAKRDASICIATFREKKIPSQLLIAELARMAGIRESVATASDCISLFSLEDLPRENVNFRNASVPP